MHLYHYQGSASASMVEMMFPVSRFHLFPDQSKPYYCQSSNARLFCLQRLRTNSLAMVRGVSAAWAVRYGACISLLLLQCHCQFFTPYERLPRKILDAWNGTFIFPSGDTQIFDQGLR